MSKHLSRSRRSITAAAVAVPVIFAATPTALPVVAVAEASTVSTYTGPAVNMAFGPVRVSLRVQGRRIVSVSATAPTGHRRSAVINGKAVPILRREVLQAQSSRIHAVSGATLTSRAFYSSLLGALHAAHL